MKAKIKRVMISADILFGILEWDSAWRVVSGIPKGSQFRGVTIDPSTQVIHLFIEHPSFSDVELGGEVSPTLEILMKKIK